MTIEKSIFYPQYSEKIAKQKISLINCNFNIIYHCDSFAYANICTWVSPYHQIRKLSFPKIKSVLLCHQDSDDMLACTSSLISCQTVMLLLALFSDPPFYSTFSSVQLSQQFAVFNLLARGISLVYIDRNGWIEWKNSFEWYRSEWINSKRKIKRKKKEL